MTIMTIHGHGEALMTTHISIAQAKAEFAALVSRAEAGEEVIVTRNGHPVARLTALPPRRVAYGDLAGVRLSEDLSLPDTLIGDFEPRP